MQTKINLNIAERYLLAIHPSKYSPYESQNETFKQKIKTKT